MEHLLSVLAFAALIAAQFFGVVFVAAMGGDVGPCRRKHGTRFEFAGSAGLVPSSTLMGEQL
jgi:hypothetical protein